jgi:hypothetical protein
LESALLSSKTENARNPVSVYKYARDSGILTLWQFEDDIKALNRTGKSVFDKFPNAPIQGIGEVNINQPFCHNVLEETIKR